MPTLDKTIILRDPSYVATHVPSDTSSLNKTPTNYIQRNIVAISNSCLAKATIDKHQPATDLSQKAIVTEGSQPADSTKKSPAKKGSAKKGSAKKGSAIQAAAINEIATKDTAIESPLKKSVVTGCSETIKEKKVSFSNDVKVRMVYEGFASLGGDESNVVAKGSKKNPKSKTQVIECESTLKKTREPFKLDFINQSYRRHMDRHAKELGMFFAGGHDFHEQDPNSFNEDLCRKVHEELNTPEEPEELSAQQESQEMKNRETAV